MNPVLFFELCPLLMAISWGCLYALQRLITPQKRHRTMSFILGIIVVVCTLVIIVSQYVKAKAYFSPANIKEVDQGYLKKISEGTDIEVDFEGNIYWHDKIIVKITAAEGKIDYVVDEIEGRLSEFCENQPVVIYKYDKFYFLAKTPIDNKTRTQWAEHHRMDSIYLWSISWVLLAGFIMVSNMDEI